MTPTYVPILKGKPGEFSAWRNASPSVIAGTRVLMEVVPTDGEDRDLSKFVNGVATRFPDNAVLTFDTGALDQTVAIAGSADAAVMWTARALYDRGVSARPVMRLGDDPDVLAEINAAVALHEQDVCLRLGSEESLPDPDEAEALIGDVLGEAGFDSDKVHLLIDFRSLDSARDVQLAQPLASTMVAWAAAYGGWASMTVASGAFPASISTLSTSEETAVHRYDADLYRAVLAAGPALEPDFGDYAIAHPAMPTPVPRGPLPNLRYTADREWQIYRERRNRPGNESFFTLCERVVGSLHWPTSGSAYSWGDSEIERCSLSAGGAGTATQWRSFGTSHHIAHVIDRLANLGEP